MTKQIDISKLSVSKREFYSALNRVKHLTTNTYLIIFNV